MSFFDELKRRNVFRVGIAYLVVAWLVMQVADVVINNVGAPAWVFQIIMLVLGIGFPVVLIFAWAFEMTPEGIKREHEVDRTQSITHKTGRKLDFTIIGILAIGLIYFVWESRFAIEAEPDADSTVQSEQAIPTEESTDKSIAVLPFADMSPNKDQEYFTDGLSEELLNLLAKIPELKVAARTSSFRFKGKTGDMADIGHQLKVGHILEGSVRKSGNRVRITAQLIKAEDGYHLWSETWDRTLDDVFAIQDEIAVAVVNALKITLLGEAPRVTEAKPEAYALYLQGRFFLNQGTRDSTSKAQIEFEKALAIDPEYAVAWAGLAETLWTRAGYGYVDFEEGMTQARTSVEKALELDSELATGWVNLAQLLSTVEWDYAGAGDAVKRAIELEPGNSVVQSYAGNYAKFIGQLDEAIAHYQKAIELDPMYHATRNQLAGAYISLGRLDPAEKSIREALYLNPNIPSAHTNLAYILTLRGEYELALAELELEVDEVWKSFQLNMTLYSMGRLEEAEAELQHYIEDNKQFWAY